MLRAGVQTSMKNERIPVPELVLAPTQPLGGVTGRSVAREQILNAVHRGRILRTWGGSGAGMSWTRFWIWTPTGGYESKTHTTAGLFDEYRIYRGSDEFLAALQLDIEEFRFEGV